MNRRTFLVTTAAVFAGAGLGINPQSAEAQDLEFIAAVERAQRDRPKHLSSKARIAPESEPGQPLVIHGRAVAEDGSIPLEDAVIFAYHTDREGHYDRAGAPAHSWRLKGWALTDVDGRFEFDTIRPGAYPRRNVPEHIHVGVFLPDGRRYWADGLVFDDDPLLPVDDRSSAGHVRREGGTQHVDFSFRLNPKNRF
jgi:protocatechuate 3,4-dioxygenase beta subunit